ncbi:MAG TPA: DNA methyltransferase, partial [Methylomirabilota bacterium]|nr:DNA methyltransferase [Methylomirabilota bacterium]
MVRKRLLDTKLNQKFVHALIGRSIFIRYLEDRNVLTSQYFQKIAKGNPKWEQCLAEELEKPDFMQGWEKRKYVKVLRNKEFTYALFNQLATDFNGDMFPKDLDEEKAIDEKKHLAPLRDFLLGDPNSEQLFFWAYDFEIIPIELISSIYEEFYHKENIYDAGKKTKAKQDDKGTHYTPSVLVEYVLSQVLTKERLATKPRILDPACGSGIFLVEAFRRVVRHEVKKKGDMLSPDELRNILRKQIWGIEINEEAIRIAAFSLYLALLHYQEPPDILQRRLPNLIYTHSWLRDEDHYHILFEKNTFALTDIEREQVNKKLQELPLYKGRAEDVRLSHSQAVLPLSLHSFDIIVGN